MTSLLKKFKSFQTKGHPLKIQKFDNITYVRLDAAFREAMDEWGYTCDLRDREVHLQHKQVDAVITLHMDEHPTKGVWDWWVRLKYEKPKEEKKPKVEKPKKETYLKAEKPKKDVIRKVKKKAQK